MDEESEQSEGFSSAIWSETEAAVNAEAQAREESAYIRQSRRQAASSNRRSMGHLWLVSYSDFMTIMMIFFLVLYGYTALAKAKLVHMKPAGMTMSQFAQVVGNLKSSLGENVQIQEDRGRVTVRLSDRVLFASGQSELTKNSIVSLEEIGKSLKLVKGDIVVEGHTDNVPIRGGRFHSNWELSAARSFRVIEALSRAGVEQGRMAAWGFGENRPLTSNLDEAGRSKNRRIEIVLINKESK